MWLVERGVHLVGIDTPSPDRDPHPVHYILLGANMVIVENLTRPRADRPGRLRADRRALAAARVWRPRPFVRSPPSSEADSG